MSEVTVQDIIDKVEELKKQIDAGGKVSDLLIRIHHDTFEKPECFGVLTDDQIATIVRGIEIHTQRELVVGKNKARIKKKFTLDDFTL